MTHAETQDCIYIEKADLQFSAGTGGDEAGEGAEAAADAEDENVGSVQLLEGSMVQRDSRFIRVCRAWPSIACET